MIFKDKYLNRGKHHTIIYNLMKPEYNIKKKLQKYDKIERME